MFDIVIRGGGIAGQVLNRELTLRGIASYMEEKQEFPREKVCGGILQWDSWQYLNSIFLIQEKHQTVDYICHHWRGKRISRIRMPQPMVFVSRWALDACLNNHQTRSFRLSDNAIRIDATGAAKARGDWIGFQCEGEQVEDLEMHYGRDIYLGMAPTPEGHSHIGFIVKCGSFRHHEDLTRKIRNELGISLKGRLKGTGRIRYGYSGRELAIGDAKLATHPFLGFGMKHAILSARLMATLIERGRWCDYDRLHRLMFRRQHRASNVMGLLYDSPLRIICRPLVEVPRLFLWGYRWLHQRPVIAERPIAKEAEIH